MKRTLHARSRQPEHATREPSASWCVLAPIYILTTILAMRGLALAQEPDAPAAWIDTGAYSGESGKTSQNNTEPAMRSPAPGPDPARTESLSPMTQPPVPRWLEEVRAQRRALQQERRAAHQARREALDPIGSAQRGQRKEQFLRRRQEMRDRIEQGRDHLLHQYYLNQGPWFAPLAPIQDGDGIDADGFGEEARSGHEGTPNSEEQPARMRPSDWNNLWYYKGW